jgi:hypothetical protein
MAIAAAADTWGCAALSREQQDDTMGLNPGQMEERHWLYSQLQELLDSGELSGGERWQAGTQLGVSRPESHYNWLAYSAGFQEGDQHGPEESHLNYSHPVKAITRWSPGTTM